MYLPSKLVAIEDPGWIKLGFDGLRVPDLFDNHAFVGGVADDGDVVLEDRLVREFGDMVSIETNTALLSKIVHLSWAWRHVGRNLRLGWVSFNVKVSEWLGWVPGRHGG